MMTRTRTSISLISIRNHDADDNDDVDDDNDDDGDDDNDDDDVGDWFVAGEEYSVC